MSQFSGNEEEKTDITGVTGLFHVCRVARVRPTRLLGRMVSLGQEMKEWF